MDANPQTVSLWDSTVLECRSLFISKALDYGASWLILRPSSLTDQLYIKALRIRTIEEAGENHVGEEISVDYQAIVNYSAMGVIKLNSVEKGGLVAEGHIEESYDNVMLKARSLMIKKNSDYGEAWKDLRITSLTDLILMKLIRIRQIEINDGKTLISEGVQSGYLDILNYAVFAMIKLKQW